jgi:hypothetical protein
MVVSGILCSLFLLSDAVMAQQSLPGDWKSWFLVQSASRGSLKIGFQIAINPVDGEKVTGTWTMLNGDCQGQYPFAGTFKNNKLRIKTEAGSKRGCGPYNGSFDLKGDKMVGRYAGQDVTLEK